MECRFHPPPTSAEGSTQSPSHILDAEHGILSDLPRNAMDLQNNRENRDRSNIPPILYESMSETIAFVFDFILSTLSISPCEPFVPQNPEDLKSQPTSDPSSQPKDLFAIILWSSEKHSFEEVAHHISEICGRTPEQATVLVNRLEDQGREIIDMGGYAIRLLEIANTISQIDLGVTVRRAYDTFREQICAVLIEWLLDLTRSRLGPDTEIMREIIAKELLSPARQISSNTITAFDKLIEGVEPCRLDWLFLYHCRLWKKPRLNLKEVYVSVLSLSHDYKITLGASYTSCY